MSVLRFLLERAIKLERHSTAAREGTPHTRVSDAITTPAGPTEISIEHEYLQGHEDDYFVVDTSLSTKKGTSTLAFATARRIHPCRETY